MNPSPPADVADIDLFDPSQLTEFEDADIERQLVSTFLGQVPGQLLELEQAIQVADAERVGAVAHKLKGSAATLGAIRMGDLCDALCRMAADGLTVEAPELYRQLVAALTRTEAAMSAYLLRRAA